MRKSGGAVANRRGEEFEQSIINILKDREYQFIEKIQFFFQHNKKTLIIVLLKPK